MCPDKVRLAREAAALQTWTTTHVPKVFASDANAGALLIEAIESETSIAESPTPPTVPAAAELLTSLHRHVPQVPSFPPVEERAAFLFDAWTRERHLNPQLVEVVPPELFERGRRFALRLAQQPSAAVLLHGDLNPGNILDGGQRRGLVAIDPAPCLGDPAFDAIDLVFALATEPAAISRCVAGLASEIGVDATRLLDWCTAFAGMEASGLAQSPNPSADDIQGFLALALEAPAARP